MSFKIGVTNRYVGNSADSADDSNHFGQHNSPMPRPVLKTDDDRLEAPRKLPAGEEDDVLTWTEDLSGSLSTPSDILFEATLVASSFERSRSLRSSNHSNMAQDDTQLSFRWPKEQQIINSD